MRQGSPEPTLADASRPPPARGHPPVSPDAAVPPGDLAAALARPRRRPVARGHRAWTSKAYTDPDVIIVGAPGGRSPSRRTSRGKADGRPHQADGDRARHHLRA